jgi:hypothetical protein
MDSMDSTCMDSTSSMDGTSNRTHAGVYIGLMAIVKQDLTWARPCSACSG